MKRLLVVLFFFLGISGCRSFRSHEWTREVRFDDSDVEFVRPEDLSRVKGGQEEAAIRKLESESFVSLSDYEYRELSQRTRVLEPEETAYLVRGVSWSERPWFSKVGYDKGERVLYVVQYTYNGEMYIPGTRESVACPMIVILHVDVSEVWPDAVWGGDSMMRLVLSEYAWIEDGQE